MALYLPPGKKTPKREYPLFRRFGDRALISYVSEAKYQESLSISLSSPWLAIVSPSSILYVSGILVCHKNRIDLECRVYHVNSNSKVVDKTEKKSLEKYEIENESPIQSKKRNLAIPVLLTPQHSSINDFDAMARNVGILTDQ